MPNAHNKPLKIYCTVCLYEEKVIHKIQVGLVEGRDFCEVI